MKYMLLLPLFISLRAPAQHKAPCDTAAAWKLVFSDEFDGNSLDRGHWHTFGNWDGMESDNWSESRYAPGQQVINEDANVQVSGGICTLQLKREEASWHCDTCAVTQKAKYTSGELFTYYTQKFRYGKFEARILMPVARKTHCTFWLWPSDATTADAPEFDVAEGYGNPFWPTPFAADNNRFTNASIHRWGPSGHAEKKIRYPRQRWINALLGNYFRQDAWHVYACEWEPDALRIYLDGRLIEAFARWYRPSVFGKKAVFCKERNDPKLKTPFWFPPSTTGCNLRLTLALDEDTGAPPGLVAEMEIDYVRVWQRIDAYK